MILIRSENIGNLRKTAGMNAVQYRVARPTHQLAALVRFYNGILGLPVIGKFVNHNGYDGVMIGLPGATHHLEFTQHAGSSPIPAPTPEHLLVFYFDRKDEYDSIIEKLITSGCRQVAPENPYWEGKSRSFEDPDGWRIVIFDGLFQPD